MDPILLAFIFFALGAVGKTVYDYLWKIIENPDLAFDVKYLMTMLVSILLTILTSPVAFLNVTIPVDGTAFIMLSSFAMGFTMNHLVNRPVSYFAHRAEEKTTEEKVQPSGAQS